MKPLSYELIAKNGGCYLIVKLDNGVDSVIDGSKVITGKSIEGLRKFGMKMAKHNGVKFVDSYK